MYIHIYIYMYIRCIYIYIYVSLSLSRSLSLSLSLSRLFLPVTHFKGPQGLIVVSMFFPSFHSLRIGGDMLSQNSTLYIPRNPQLHFHVTHDCPFELPLLGKCPYTALNNPVYPYAFDCQFHAPFDFPSLLG